MSLKASFNDWLQLNPGKRITIHDVAKLNRLPYIQAFTPSDITNGMVISGISLFNRNIFAAEAFLGIAIHAVKYNAHLVFPKYIPGFPKLVPRLATQKFVLSSCSERELSWGPVLA